MIIINELRKVIQDIRKNAWIESAKAHIFYDEGVVLADENALPFPEGD